MDAFYASVELRRRPELKGKPVVVCGSGPRAVVTTASYEARKLAGIHSAMPAAVARRRLPDAVYLQPDFPAYREASGQVMDVLRRNVEVVEVVGLDEAYLDLTGLFSPKATMRRVVTVIRTETRLTCSVGISESRMLAKITSELGKPAGMVVLARDQALERFADHSPGLIPGIGPKTVSRLEAMGIRTLADLRDWERPALEDRFGPRSGAWLHARGNLLDETPIVPEHETKSQSTEITFDHDVNQRHELERHIAELSEELCRRLRKRVLAGRTIGIKVRLDDWTNVTRSHTLDRADQRSGGGRPGRPRPTARLRPAAAGAAARRPPRLLRRQRGGGRAGADTWSAPTRPRLLAARQYRPDARKPESLLDRLGQVVVAPCHVGAAVDHRRGHGATVVAQLHLGPARQRLVRDADRVRQQGAAAGDAVAVEAGTVVGGPGQPVGRQLACGAARGADAPVVDTVGADREAAGLARAPSAGRKSRSPSWSRRGRPGRRRGRRASPGAGRSAAPCRAPRARSPPAPSGWRDGGRRGSATARWSRLRSVCAAAGARPIVSAVAAATAGRRFQHLCSARFLLPTGLADGLAGAGGLRLSLRAAQPPDSPRPRQSRGKWVPRSPALGGEGTRQIV